MVLGKPSLSFGVLICKMGVAETTFQAQGEEGKSSSLCLAPGGSYSALVGFEPRLHSEDTDTPSHLSDPQ